MTPQERQDYNRLSREGKEQYDMYMRNHPGAPHEDAYKIAVLHEKLVNALTTGNKNITTNEPKTLKGILEKTSEFISKEAPRVWAKVRNEFQNAIEYLGDLIRRGINWIENNIVNPIIDFLDGIFG